MLQQYMLQQNGTPPVVRVWPKYAAAGAQRGGQGSLQWQSSGELMAVTVFAGCEDMVHARSKWCYEWG
jgi:hypothetical protein